MGSATLSMILAAQPGARPPWADDGMTFSMLWKPEEGDLSMRVVAQRAEEYAAVLKVRVVEVARVPHTSYKDHEGVYIRTEKLV